MKCMRYIHHPSKKKKQKKKKKIDENHDKMKKKSSENYVGFTTRLVICTSKLQANTKILKETKCYKKRKALTLFSSKKNY